MLSYIAWLIFIVLVGVTISAFIAERPGAGTVAGIFATLGLVFVVFTGAVVIVEPNTRSIGINRSNGNTWEMGPGLHVIPLVFGTEVGYSTIQQQINWTDENPQASPTSKTFFGRTSDGQEFVVDSTLSFQVRPECIRQIYANFGDSRSHVSQMANQWREDIYNIINARSASELQSSEEGSIYDLMAADAEPLLQDRIQEQQFCVNLLNIGFRNLEFNEQYAAAIEAVGVAQQQEIAAVSQAAAERTRAGGQADAILIVAEAEAEQARLLGEANYAVCSANGALPPTTSLQDCVSRLSVASVLARSGNAIFVDNGMESNLDVGERGASIQLLPTATPSPSATEEAGG